METFTGKMRGKLVPYAGPRDQATVFGAPILACPTCSGTGRVVKDDELADAWRRPQELQQVSVTAMLAFPQGEGQVLRLLPKEQQRALELAEKLGSLVTSGVITFDEKAVRGDFFCRLRGLKDKHGARLSWETLRHVTVKLYPPLRADFSHWRALRMACLRAQPSKGGVYTMRPAYTRGKGFTLEWAPVDPVSGASAPDSGQAMRKFGEEQDVRLLGKRLVGVRRRLSEALGRVSQDSWDMRILLLASEFLNEAVRQRAAGGANSKVVRRCEQLLRLVRTPGAVDAGEA